MRTFYSEYVQHCMRFYTRHPHPTFRNDVDKLNWNACDAVMREFNDDNREIILSVYSDGDTVPDNVYKTAVARGINQDIIWKLLNLLERKVAKRRHLI